MPLQFGRSGLINLGEESSYGAAAALTVTNRFSNSSREPRKIQKVFFNSERGGF